MVNHRLRTWWWSILGVVAVALALVLPRVVSMTSATPLKITNVERESRVVHPKRLIALSEAVQRMPILMYHYIRTCDDPEDKNCPSLSVSPEVFSEQMTWLHDHGYVTVDLDYFRQPYAVNGTPVVLTFDDGYRDNYAAVSTLEQFGFFGTWYIISDRVGDDQYLDWPQIKDMVRRGMIIGSHSEDHADMTKVDDQALHNEVTKSRNVLIERLGASILDFSYPFGIYNNHVEQAVKEAGYRTATTTQEGIAAFTDTPWELSRVRMKENIDLAKALAISPDHVE